MRTGILFPGYGGQLIGMAKALYDESRIVQEYFEEASNCLNVNFVKLCFASSDTDIAQMSAAYPSIFLVSCALYAVIRDKGITPDMVVGCNTGDYGALYAAKSITFPDGLYLLHKYAHYYQTFLDEQPMHMCAVNGIAYDALMAICKKASTKQELVNIGISYNDHEHMIGGHPEAVNRAQEALDQHDEGVTYKKQSVAYGLHSALMDPVAEPFKISLEKVDFKDPVITCISSQAQILVTSDQIKTNVTESIREPVLFNKVLDSLAAYELIIQVGPGDELSKLVKEKYPDTIIITVQDKEDFEQLAPYIPEKTTNTETTEHDN